MFEDQFFWGGRKVWRRGPGSNRRIKVLQDLSRSLMPLCWIRDLCIFLELANFRPSTYSGSRRVAATVSATVSRRSGASLPATLLRRLSCETGGRLRRSVILASNEKRLLRFQSCAIRFMDLLGSILMKSALSTAQSTSACVASISSRLTYNVYPGASHKRFEHCLGVMEIASRIYDVVDERQNVLADSEIRSSIPKVGAFDWNYWRRVLRMAALCHDLGHLPFSTRQKDLLPGGVNHRKHQLRNHHRKRGWHRSGRNSKCRPPTLRKLQSVRSILRSLWGMGINPVRDHHRRYLWSGFELTTFCVILTMPEYSMADLITTD